MKVVKLTISNFRCVKYAEICFDGHTLLVGANNVGKSTVCEALDLALGLDRLKRFPPVEEFDFFNAQYLETVDDILVAKPIEIEVVLSGLPEELSTKCFDRLERWHLVEKRILGAGELDLADAPSVVECIRIKTIAKYNIDDDEFEAKSIFCSGPKNADGSDKDVPRSIRQLFGFVYLRTLRTGSRALSLERGSLLDIILKRQSIKTGIWENTIRQLRDLTPPIDDNALGLSQVMDSIEKRLGQYIPLSSTGRSSRLYVSQLKREHLRKTIAFFLKTSVGQEPVPFQEVGTGTLNALVLALLSFIADIKNNDVIFAMEEPEIALPPHTQRRIADYLLSKTSQCFVTSHSPYVIECFSPEQIQVLKCADDNKISASSVAIGDIMKSKTYKRHSRRAISEAMLGRGVIVCEGVTEKDIILAAAQILESDDVFGCYPLDLSGVSVISVDGDGALAEFGAFFKSLGIYTFAFYDKRQRQKDENEKIQSSFDYMFETDYVGSELMLVEECNNNILWNFLNELKERGVSSCQSLPDTRPNDDEVKVFAKSVLRKDKGSGYAGCLITLCQTPDLPASVTSFLKVVYERFSRPEPTPDIQPKASSDSSA